MSFRLWDGMERGTHKCLKSLAAISLAVTALTACHTVSGNPPVSLAGTSWRLVSLQSSDDAIGTIRPDDPAKYELTFGGDGRVAARLDCNRGSGTYTQTATNNSQGAVTFGPMAMTRAMCPPGSLDMRLGRELGFVRSYLLNGDRLTLVMMADGGNQVWQRAASDGAKNDG